jgi:hypothetical protein
LKPDHNGRLLTSKILNKYENSYEMQSLIKVFRGKKKVTFNEYFDVMASFYLKRKRSL